jgi:hypothetical protein
MRTRIVALAAVRGQYCAARYKSQYKRYGYTCARDSSGVYRLR